MYSKEIHLKLHPTLGYYYFFDKSHPLSYSDGKVWHHRHVASLKLGRWVSGDEHVHHLDRDRGNNHPDNLEVLTQSEHTRKHALEDGISLADYMCQVCNTLYHALKSTQTTCSNYCRSISQRKVERPDVEELEKLVWTIPTTKLAEALGVSGKTIEKWCKSYGIEKPPRGYWAKKLSLESTA